ncbi:MAG: hypothetical protein AAGF96_17655 [Bacteroidota bacterium]
MQPTKFSLPCVGRLYFDIEGIHNYFKPLLEDFRKAFGYSELELLEFKEKIEEELEIHSNSSLEWKHV